MKIEITDNSAEVVKQLTEQLKTYRSNLKFQIFRALTLVEAEILQNLRTRSGLRVVTGNLLNSVGASKKVVEDGNGITGEIGSVGVPYAAIHEFGGTTKPHRIEPRRAAALAFMQNGETKFAKFVEHPGSKIPARPYIRPALAATQETIVERFGLFLQATFDTKDG